MAIPEGNHFVRVHSNVRVPELQSANSKSAINMTASESVKEISERNMRKENVIMTNIAESVSNDTNERKMFDHQQAEKILRAVNVEANIVQVIRLGQRSSHPRPMKVKLSSEKEQKEILKRARTLKDIDDYKNIYINRDLTPLEQKERKSLLEELKKKKQESEEKGGEERWIIRKGKVVLAGPRK